MKSCYSKPASKPCKPARSSPFRIWAPPASPAPRWKWLRAAGTGIEIDLAKVPQRETGMTPYEIMLSESQERMLLVAEKGREPEVLAVFKKWGLDAVVVGSVTEAALPASTTTAASPRKFPRIRSPKKAPFTIAPSRTRAARRNRKRLVCIR